MKHLIRLGMGLAIFAGGAFFFRICLVNSFETLDRSSYCHNCRRIFLWVGHNSGLRQLQWMVIRS